MTLRAAQPRSSDTRLGPTGEPAQWGETSSTRAQDKSDGKLVIELPPPSNQRSNFHPLALKQSSDIHLFAANPSSPSSSYNSTATRNHPRAVQYIPWSNRLIVLADGFSIQLRRLRPIASELGTVSCQSRDPPSNFHLVSSHMDPPYIRSTSPEHSLVFLLQEICALHFHEKAADAHLPWFFQRWCFQGSSSIL